LDEVSFSKPQNLSLRRISQNSHNLTEFDNELANEKFAKSKTAKLFLTRSNSELLEQINGFTNSKSSNDVNIDGIKTNLCNGRLNTNHSDTKLKNNNYSNNSIISNNSITKSGPSSSSTGGFSKSSRNSFNPNDRESVM